VFGPDFAHAIPCYNEGMLRLLRLLFGLLVRVVIPRRELLFENLALRQQLAALQRRNPQLRFRAADRLFWILLRRFWPGWRQALVLVQPATVVRLCLAKIPSAFSFIVFHPGAGPGDPGGS
jgi:hypothetical protein